MSTSSLAVGIDVGGTKLLAALVDVSSGAVVDERRAATNAAAGGAAVLRRCVALVGDLLAGRDLGTIPIGVALCELVDPAGAPTSAATVDWLELDVGAAFAELGPVTIDSDVRAAAIAEASFGAGAMVDQFVYVGVGTGIAFTLMLDGKPHRGAGGNAILLGIPPVEGVASGTAIAARTGHASAHEAFDDPACAEVIADAAAQLGVALAWLNNALDPALIVVGGGLGLRVDYRELAVSAMQAAVTDAGGVPAVVRPALLGEASAAIGAALVAAHT